MGSGTNSAAIFSACPGFAALCRGPCRAGFCADFPPQEKAGLHVRRKSGALYRFYRTDFLYGGDINFTNMKSYLLGSGYQHLTADIDFPSSQRQNAWGVNDDITFDYLYDQLIGRKESPWHTAFLTLSSHEPFEVPFHKLEEARPNAFAFHPMTVWGGLLNASAKLRYGTTC